MSSYSAVQDESLPSVFIPVSRVRAVARGLVWTVLGLGLARTVAYFVSDLRLVPSAVSNRIGDYAVLVAMVPLSVVSLVLLYRGLKWLALGMWPSRIGFVFTARGLSVRLGPFGSRVYAAGHVRVRYPFEMSDDEAARSSFEAFLPEEEQIATLVPQIVPPDGAAIRLDLMRYSGRAESDLAARLSPILSAWRAP
ncbi:MAG: hypothetical protein C4547_13610 [Phycisphaerales bacterium]|nr:MAG: hypothetical protein C4547_13610 [Phycisphaerales bacterium]